MKFSAKHIFISLAAIAALGSCKPTIVPDDNVNYEYMFECLWTLDAYSERQTEIPPLFMDSDKYLYFTADGRVAVLTLIDGLYSYQNNYTCLVDRGTNRMTLAWAEDEGYFFVIDRVCETHMTLLYNGEETEYVTYRRSDIFESDFDKGSFPEGWFE